jgi:hypothetical protein
MHTSDVLRAEDFRYLRHAGREMIEEDFGSFCPSYDARDRVGIVSPRFEDGILGTGCAVLALTTAFYDVLRSHSQTFFDYPQHFAFVGTSVDMVMSGNAPVLWEDAPFGSVWGNLDVWPQSQWISSPMTAIGMLQKVFDIQISILFWPEDLKPEPGEPVLPGYVRRMLEARLHHVYYYRTADCDWMIEGRQPVVDIVGASLQHLPQTVTHVAERVRNGVYREILRSVPVSEWLRSMAACFEPS